MPAGKVCSKPGCPEFEPCALHPKQRAPDDPSRGTSIDRGYGPRWRRYSESYRKQHPHCAPCLKAGRTVPTALVDHIEPVTGPGDPRFWDPTNHQSACLSCHAVKTRQEGRTQQSAREPRPARRWRMA